MSRDELVNQLIQHEGFRAKPYRCTAGKLTIGIGRNIEDRGITLDEAMVLLNNDIDLCVKDLEHHNLSIMSTIKDERRNVLINMCFNLGINRLKGFRNMWAALEIGDYDKAADEMLDSRWARQVGERALELADIMRTGIY